MYQNSEDTIIALSTPSGESLRAIIRVSGPDAISCLDGIFVKELDGNRFSGNGISGIAHPQLVSANTNRIQTNSIGSCNLDNNIIANSCTFKSINGYLVIRKEKTALPVAIYIMKSPFSFTKEHVIEVHTFGSTPFLEMILNEILYNRDIRDSQGSRVIRLAEPGEFTKRAFLNGRIDLIQAEASIKLIRARSESDIKTAISHLKGNIGCFINGIKDNLLDLCGRIEASIDFADQDIELVSNDEIIEELNVIYNKLLEFADGKNIEKQINSDNINVILFGRPNVGKSSILNSFTPDIKTIVSDIPHTTRDSVKRVINIDQICFNFFDNPGIDFELEQNEYAENEVPQLEHYSQIDYSDDKTSTVQTKSFAISEDSIFNADIILFVLDGSNELTRQDNNLFKKIDLEKSLVILNKCDLPQKVKIEDIVDIGIELTVVKTSTVTGVGLAEIKRKILEIVKSGSLERSGSCLMANARQKHSLNKSFEFLKYAIESAENMESLEFIALDCRNAMDSLGEIVGEVLSEDILNKIFADFCIGK